MPMKSYGELLRDPRWQEKRLRVMDRAGFICEECGSAERTLNVHHTYYERGKMPWDYPEESLRCLCEPCHELSHVLVRAISQMFGAEPSADLWKILGYLRGLRAWRKIDDVPILIREIGFVDGLADAWGLTVKQVQDGAVNGKVTSDRLMAIRNKVRRGL